MVSPYLLAVPSVVHVLLSNSDKKCIQTTETEGFFFFLTYLVWKLCTWMKPVCVYVSTHSFIYIYIYICMYVHMCVYMYVYI